jgi:hypothetical protein
MALEERVKWGFESVVEFPYRLSAGDVCRASPSLLSAFLLISWSMSLNLCLCDDFEEDLEETFEGGLADPFEDDWDRPFDDEFNNDLEFFELLPAEVECSDTSPGRDRGVLIRLWKGFSTWFIE